MTVSVAAVLLLIAGLVVGAGAAWFVMRSFAESRLEAITGRLKADLYESNAQIAQSQREAFLTLANDRLDAAVAPVKEKLCEVDKLVREIESSRVDAYAGLREQISALMDRSGKMELAASQLTSALRNPTTRGKWGEVQLRRVVELAGMEPYCDFCEQQTLGVEDGGGRPDLTVQLPGDRHVFVDAKVPLTAYLDAAETHDDDSRQRLLKAHAVALKGHVDSLARRRYHRADGSADFVVMFVPGEAFLSAACIENPELIEYGAGKDVFIVSPLTMMALLRSYALGWQQQAQDENAKRIAEASRELYDRVRIFASHFAAIGGGLSKAITAFNAAVASMESRVLPQGRRIKELASLPDAELPDVQAVELAPRDVAALDPAPGKQRTKQPDLFRGGAA